MLALVRDGEHDPPVAVREVPEPEPAAHEALVGVRASSLNRGELALLANRDDGWRPGQDVAGVVTRPAADGSGPPTGARVAGLVEGAAWAERVAVPTARLAELPDGVDFERASTLGIAGLTALRIVRLGGSLIGRSVLVTAAGGAVGRLALQLAARVGARVTAQVRSPGRHPALADLGAAEILSREDVPAAGFDLVLDGVGGTGLEQAIAAVRPGGTVVLFGATVGEPARVALFDFVGHEGARIVPFLSYASGTEEDIGADLATLAGLVGDGDLETTVGLVVDWREPEHAIEALREGDVEGKAVLVVGG